MSTYKVIQDIEAEDHIIGPFSLRQFVYLLISLFFGYISVIIMLKGAVYFDILFIPFVLFFGFLAFPFIKDQPTEVWALAKIRFLAKPRKRLWNQTGIKNNVTITVPKKINKQLTKNLDNNEVKNRLKRLSETIDSRGWVIKNIDGPILQFDKDDQDADRLIMPTKEVPDETDLDNKFDILDSDANPTASKIDSMITETEYNHRQRLINLVNSAPQTPQLPKAHKAITSPVELPIKLKKTETTQEIQAPTVPAKPVTEITKETNNSVKNAIINFSGNDNLSLQTMSKEINKKTLEQEVVISLR